MSDSESRALRRAGALLLVASLARLAWERERAPVSLEAPEAPARLLEESRALAGSAAARSRPLAPGERIDPNRASEEELDRLPGVGAATAQAIVASREADGPFAGLEELSRVRGIGPATLERIAPFVEIESRPTRGRAPPERGRDRAPAAPAKRSPVDVNRAGAAELRSLPGIGPALAERILEARREAPFASVDDLARVPGIGPATVARLRPLVTVVR